MDELKNTGNIFNKYAGEYESRYMDLSLYAEALDKFLALIKTEDAGVLDIGCGPGNITKYLLNSRPGLKITGIDIAGEMIQRARTNNPQASFELLDGRRIDELKNKFDAVVAGFFLPYLSKKEAEGFIGKCAGSLRSEGIIYLSFMEDDYNNSGYLSSSRNEKEKLFTYYHEAGYIEKFLVEAGFGILNSKEIENQNNKPGIKDRVIICQSILVKD
ncbi:class I SAM-dependent methyltransferase [Pontixanthobacter gangjinensis]|uniref:Class I SAM-dependent methyltransferase n=1 Tax=Christiangramia aestuarii TaxID=1028746 RepID=A0A7K1LNE1_9FLAO|nr:class I SAM-dependent methyltransferase [Christiangramia aestuarii]MUP42306.1 class I SAM-dependent methyltransferase [Christiangramia aestuarii]